MEGLIRLVVDEILFAMEIRDLTRKQLAYELGVSQSRVNAILNGTHPNITLATLEKITNALDMEIDFSMHPVAA